MANRNETATAPAGTGNTETSKRGKGKRLTREQRGLPPLTAAQTIAKQNVQNAQNACQFIKQHIDEGNMVSAEVLQACSTLSGALGGMLGE